MPVSVVLSVHNNGADLMPLIETLVAHTSEDSYEFVLVDRASTDETVAILQMLEGDVTIVRLPNTASATEAINAGFEAAKCEVIALVYPRTRFVENWLGALTQPLMHAPANSIATPAESAFPTLDLLAIPTSTLERVGVFDETLADSRALNDFLQRVTTAGGSIIRAGEQPVNGDGLQIDPDLIGRFTGIALVEILNAGVQGAKIGQLPEAAAEILRERLWAEEEHRLLQIARNGRDVCWTDEHEAEPLVTVRIATYNRCEQLMDLTLPSIFEQSYQRFEIIVVGDHTDDETTRAMGKLDDPRVRYINLPVPSVYPQDRWRRWYVTGSPPMNLGLDLARGSWIAPCDDDDEFTQDHIESLLTEARRNRWEFIWSKTLMETPQGWQAHGSEPLLPQATTSGAVMWSAGLRFMKMSTTSWKFNEAHDGNLYRRMEQIGVKMGFFDHITYRYYMSRIYD